MAQEKPIGKGLANTFEKAAKAEIECKEIAALIGVVDEGNPEILPGGMMSRLGLTDSKLAYSREKKRKKEFRDWLLREAVRRSLHQIDKIVEELQKQVEEILEGMAESEGELSKLDEQHEILKAELEYFKEHGLFDCDQHGRLKNPEAEAILLVWEKKTGHKIDRTDPASYKTILAILLDIEQRQAILQDGLKKDASDYELRKQQLDEALEIRDGLQSGDPLLNQQALFNFDLLVNDLEKGPTKSHTNEDKAGIEGGPAPETAFESSPKNNGDLSFGFPPLNDHFGHAVADKEILPSESAPKTGTLKKSPPAVNPVH